MDSSSFLKSVLLNGKMWFCRCLKNIAGIFWKLHCYRNLAPEKTSSELPPEPQLNSSRNLTTITANPLSSPPLIINLCAATLCVWLYYWNSVRTPPADIYFDRSKKLWAFQLCQSACTCNIEECLDILILRCASISCFEVVSQSVSK